MKNQTLVSIMIDAYVGRAFRRLMDVFYRNYEEQGVATFNESTNLSDIITTVGHDVIFKEIVQLNIDINKGCAFDIVYRHATRVVDDKFKECVLNYSEFCMKIFSVEHEVFLLSLEEIKRNDK